MRQETKTSSEFEPSSEVPVRKRTGARLILGIVFIFLILVGFAWLLANLHWVPKVGEPLVDVRSEVTGVEDPRTTDGDIDYLEAINQDLSRGINPSDNTMVHYLSVNRQAIDSQFLDEVFEEMGGVLHQMPMHRLIPSSEKTSILTWLTGRPRSLEVVKIVRCVLVVSVLLVMRYTCETDSLWALCLEAS